MSANTKTLIVLILSVIAVAAYVIMVISHCLTGGRLTDKEFLNIIVLLMFLGLFLFLIWFSLVLNVQESARKAIVSLVKETISKASLRLVYESTISVRDKTMTLCLRDPSQRCIIFMGRRDEWREVPFEYKEVAEKGNITSCSGSFPLSAGEVDKEKLYQYGVRYGKEEEGQARWQNILCLIRDGEVVSMAGFDDFGKPGDNTINPLVPEETGSGTIQEETV